MNKPIDEIILLIDCRVLSLQVSESLHCCESTLLRKTEIIAA
jgi:hypothetical protein